MKWAVWGRMYNTGQTCCAAKRFIVVDQVADKFLEQFKAALGGLKAGDPLDEKTTLGPLSTESALVDLLKQVDVAVAHGAKVVMGGKRIDRAGSFMQPTILTDVTPANPAFRNEFFGPVAMFGSRTRTRPSRSPTIRTSGWADPSSPGTSSEASAWRAVSRRE